MKTLAAMVAVVALVAGLWIGNSPSHASTITLGDVLAKLGDAEALQFKVVRNGQVATVWVNPRGMVRWENSPTSYGIARGSRLWRVDESTTSTPSTSNPPQKAEGRSHVSFVSIENPWLDEQGQIDLLALLDLRPDDREGLLRAEPTEQETFAGKSCLVFRRIVTGEGQRYRLEVFVDVATEQLVGITARNPDVVGGPPLAEMTLLALNPPVDDSKFRVPVALAESDRIGKVTDTQGIVVLRPVGSRRWTPVCRQLLIQPGDWVRTDVRGANAATIELDSHQKLVIGPASLIEIISPTEARVHSGSVHFVRNQQTVGPFTLRGLGDDLINVELIGKVLYRLNRAEKLEEVQGKPKWLQYYEGSSSDDSIGSLIVNVDGREQSLSVGEHHVTVEIRDQIARTTIEETFVNHTGSRLEGQFHFPLPQDASISGFGMWINGELIEADVVEKQRAREIYETILREKRDPGLLEWTGGNIFKARVFPIEPHSDKRVKITYTQVLPLRGNRFRYNYALKSEMLLTNPLKELSIRVLLNSAVPLAEVTSPTHSCRTQLTKHSAELEFTAQEYTPTKDFELVCEVDHRENDLLVIPHQRGDDGYFLMQLMPPGAEGQWAREVIPDGEPLNVILLCDTSGSMDADMRKKQEQFVTTLLTSLSDKDRFTLATADVETEWAFADFVSNEAANIANARDFLDKRISLGWTDLDQAFDAVLKRAQPGCQIVYVGDGIVSTVESDPAAFVNRLKRLNAESSGKTQPAGKSIQPTFHAVSVGSTYESIVLKGIASLGGGSSRQISGETTPQETALELLNEIAQPGLKNVNVEFRGIRVAAVYPETLPNIAAGTQQILVGRYLPQGDQQTGEVVVTGMLNGTPVKYVAKIELKNAEAGNSFIPRLWGRGRLESLLQEGSTQKIQEEIIGLSEEFHIITPYTSLLVLETDADRERFGVKRRFEMRDGERFFAEGRNNANYELQQQQMRRAGNWRLGLRRQLLSQLIGLGRDAGALSGVPLNPVDKLSKKKTETSWNIGGKSLGQNSGISSRPGIHRDKARLSLDNNRTVDLPVVMWDMASRGSLRSDLFELGELSGMSLNPEWGAREESLEDRIEPLSSTSSPHYWSYNPAKKQDASEFAYSTFGDADDWQSEGKPGEESFDRPTWEDRPSRALKDLSNPAGNLLDELHKFEMPSLMAKESSSDYDLDGADFELRITNGTMLHGWAEPALGLQVNGGSFGRRPSLGLYDETNYSRGRQSQPDPYHSIQWVDTYFPHLSPAPIKNTDVPNPQPNDPLKSGWTDAAVKLSQSLLREAVLRELPGGIEIERTISGYNSGFRRVTPSDRRLELWSKSQWMTRDYGQGRQPIVNWLDSKERGVYSEAFLLGQSRPSVESEFESLPLHLPDHSLTPLHESYRNYRIIIEHLEGNRVVLRCIYLHKETSEVRFTIDTDRHVLLKQESIEDGKLTSTVTHSEFVEAAGLWWATRIETVSAQHPDRVTYRITQTVKEHTADSFTKAFATHQTLKTPTLFLTPPIPSVRQAKQAVAAGTATASDRFLLMLHFAISQKWEEGFEQLRAWETLVKGKSGSAWVRIAFELAASREEEARQKLVKQLDNIVGGTLPQGSFAPAWEGGDLFLTAHTLSSLFNITGWNEYSEFITKVKPIFARQPNVPIALHDWNTRWLQVLDSLGRTIEAFELQKEMLEEVPGDVYIRTLHAGRISMVADVDAALAFLKVEMAKGDHWDQSELSTLRFSYADILEGRGRYEEVLAFYEEWLPLETTQSNLFGRYLSALVMNNRPDDAETQMLAWLKIVEQEGKLSAVDLGKVHAAISLMFGQGHNLSRYYGMERKWLPALYAAARHCVNRDDRVSEASTISQNHNFSQSDEGDRLRGDIVAMLVDPKGLLLTPIQVGNDAIPTAPLTLPIPESRLTMLLSLARGGRLLVGDGDAIQIRQVTTAEWTTIADTLLKWWEATPNVHQKYQLSYQLNSLHSHALTERHLPFLRRRVAEASADYIDTYRSELYNTLLSQPWTEALEAELFTLWPQLVPTETVDSTGKKVAVLDSVRTSQLVPLLYRLVDTMLQSRVSAASSALQDMGDVDAATRTERAKSAADILKEAREGLADRLQKESGNRGFDESLLSHWIRAERIYLDMLLDRNKGDVLKWAWNEVGEAPPKFVPPVKKEGDAVDVDDLPKPTPHELADRFITARLDTLLKQRAWATLMNLASRKSANEQLITKVLAYIDAGIAIGEEASAFVNAKLKEQGAEEEERVDFTISWRSTKYNALILFDRPEELITALKQWIAKDKWNIPWRRSLAKLLAEQGDLKGAIAQMESVEKEDELTPQDYAAIAGWYLVVDQREAYERSRIETYKAMQEWQLNNMLNQQVNIIANSPGPHELDENTFFMLEALFEKSAYPSNFYWTVRSLYTSTRDFRLLERVAESLLGRTQESVYPALSNLQSQIVEEVRDEATADEILKHIHKLRDQIKTGWVPRGADPDERSKSLDLRALDLFESMIERKASSVLNQPGPHGKAALITFQRAFTQGWQQGERLRYAQFLQQIGAVTHERNDVVLTPLADEQLRQMRQLFDDSEAASVDRVRIGLAHSQLLFYGYDKQDEGALTLEAALGEFATAHNGLIPYEQNDLVNAYSSMLQTLHRYAKAEPFVQKHLDVLENDGQRWTYIEHLNSLHQHALYHKGTTTLGAGTTLFDNFIKRLSDLCDTNDDGRRYNVLYMIGNTFQQVCQNVNLNIPTARQKLISFANQDFPKLIDPQHNNYANLIQHFGSVLKNCADSLEAFSFLLDRVEDYPARFEYGYQDAWHQFGWQLADFHYHAAAAVGPKGPLNGQQERFERLEARLLPIVLRELRADLINLRSRNQAFYHNDHTFFWGAKAADFLKVAEEVLAERTDSPRTITYIAEYLYQGLDKSTRAIEVLFIAHKRGLLDDEGQLQLVRYLHEQNRYAESIALLEPLNERRTDEMHLRVLLIRAYHFSQRPQQLAEFTAATDAHFHKEGRWIEGNVIEFARVLAQTSQDQRASECFEEAISLHQNTHPNRGIGNGTLSYYYQEVAAVYSRLGNDEKAVDSAAAGVVSWGSNVNNRNDAIGRLKSTIASIKDLEAFLKSLDAKANKTGEDSPLLRKMAGSVLKDQKKFALAIEQFRTSLELQPYDRDVHQWLLESFDELNDNAGAVQQLLAQIDFDRHNLSLYISLAKRTKENPELAERAATSILEQAPSEAESFQALAEFREAQDRYRDALPLWRRVADLRKLEPTGLINLAEAQLKLNDFQGAKATFDSLRKTEWPDRFKEVLEQARQLEKQIP